MAHIDRLNSLRETAALLYERANQENAPAENRSALDAWLAESLDHAVAYQAISQTWSALKGAAQDPAILSLRQETARRLTPTHSASRRPLRWAAAALLILFLGASLWILVPRAGFEFSPLAWLESESQTPMSRTYATKRGDRLSITLDDGSRITLNTATQLDAVFSKKARTVRLVHGEALFEVAKDAFRPFVVQTDNHRFIAVGTAFDVHIETDQVKLTMLEGTVRAEHAESGATVRTTVTAGEQLIANSHAEDRIRRIDPERETSWRRGQVIFDNTPLSEAVDELNRYSSTHIELADPKLADLRLSGTFATGGTSAFVEAIAAYFPIQIEHPDARTVTLKAVH
jgi:transmembrane sensor